MNINLKQDAVPRYITKPTPTDAQRLALDLALVRNPAIVLAMSRAAIENLRGTTREIAALINELPWISANMGVLAAALLGFNVPDRLTEYCEWLTRCPAEVAALAVRGDFTDLPFTDAKPTHYARRLA